MSFLITYKNLCEVNILHSYFLNDGIDEFNSMTASEKSKMMKTYDINKFFNVVPTIETQRIMKNNNIVYKITKSGIRLGVKISPNDENLTFSNINLNTTLNFIIRIKDYLFGNYTNATLSSDQIFFFSNAKPFSELVGFEYITLNSSVDFITDDYKLPAETTKKIIETLSVGEKNQVFGIISLKMEGDSSTLDILSAAQEIIEPTPIFKIHFNNRRTFWKYIKSNSSFEVETSLEQPLTENGFVEISPDDFTTSPPEASDYKYPNPSAKSIQKIASKTYSQIFI
ncbi:MAG: hypothetical protein QM535_11055 [Limnohabitans sp.]|nr:hypothetical protein [Limnohabitans sp.]